MQHCSYCILATSSAAMIEIFDKMAAFSFQSNSIALHTNILVVITIVFSPRAVFTVCQVGFMALAVHIIQPDGIPATPVMIAHRQPGGVTQHLADDISFLVAKKVATDGAPSPIVVNFHSSIVRVRSINKTDWKA